MTMHPETPMGEPLPSVTIDGSPVDPESPVARLVARVLPPAWAGSLTASASVTGYGPTADAIRAEVDADDAKDKLIASLREQVTALDRDWNAERDKRLSHRQALEKLATDIEADKIRSTHTVLTRIRAGLEQP